MILVHIILGLFLFFTCTVLLYFTITAVIKSQLDPWLGVLVILVISLVVAVVFYGGCQWL